MKNLNDFYRTTTEMYSECMLFDNLLTYKEGYELAMERASFILSKGHKRGDVIAIHALNSREWIMTYMAITMCGCIALPLDNNLSAQICAEMLKTVKCKTIYTDNIAELKIRGIKVYDIDFTKNTGDIKKFKAPAVDSDYPASYVFTSGTTGNPKVVTLTHGNIFNTSISDSDWLGLSPSDNFLCILPLFHVYAFLANFGGPYAKGASLVFLQSLKGPDIIDALKNNDFTVFPAAPQLWEMFMDSILKKAKSASNFKYSVLIFFLESAPFFKAIGLSFLLRKVFAPVRQIFGESMLYFISGGASLKKKYFKYYLHMGLPIIEGYGLTETTGPICISHVKKNKMGSVGPAMPGNEIRIKKVNRDKIGEIWLKGHSVMKEYYNNPQQTACVFDDEGFFDTGDLGRVDKDGYLFITGRAKNVIVLDSGKNVYPEELESFYKNSPEIAEIAVFGKKVEDRESVFAVIVPENKSAESYEKVASEIKRLNKGVPGYKTISSFALSFDPLPVNSARKVVLSKVEEKLERGDYMSNQNDSLIHQQELAGTTEREDEVIEILRKELGASTLYANENLAEYGLDSLGTIELVVTLEERLKVPIAVDEFRKHDTLQELVTYLATLEEGNSENQSHDLLSSPIITRPFSFYNPINEFLAFILKNLILKVWRLKVENRENLSIDNTILTANHQSNLDYLLTYALLPYSVRKDLYVIGKKELKFLKFIFPGVNVLFVERGGNVMHTLKAGADLLRQGKTLFIFPEGTRSTDGELQPFKTGAAYLAKNLNKTIIPIAIEGTGRILPKGRSFPYFKTSKGISLSIGTAIDPAKNKNIETLNRKIQNSTKKLLKTMNG